MTKIQTCARSLFLGAALVGGAFVTQGASAGLVTYSGLADIVICLNRVNDGSGGTGSPGACEVPGQGGPTDPGSIVSSDGEILDLDTSSSGGGSADVVTFINENLESGLVQEDAWELGTEVLQSSESFGDVTGPGEASSFADTAFSILLQNESADTLFIELVFSSFVDTSVTIGGPGQDAGAYAETALSFTDSLQDAFFRSSAESFVGGNLADSEAVIDFVNLELAAGEDTVLYGFVYSDGYAIAVPLAPTHWLLVAGMFMLLAFRRHNHAELLATRPNG
jgi:hypothetical protein